jgi:hypothetical protein
MLALCLTVLVIIASGEGCGRYPSPFSRPPTYNQFGELTPVGAPIIVDVPDANGVAILPSRGEDRN